MTLKQENIKLKQQIKHLRATIKAYEDKFKDAKAYLYEQLGEIEKRGER